MSSRRSSRSNDEGAGSMAPIGGVRRRTGSGSSIHSRSSVGKQPSSLGMESNDKLSCHFRYTGCYLLIIISDGSDMLRQEHICQHMQLHGTAAAAAAADEWATISTDADVQSLKSKLADLDIEWNRKFVEHTIQGIAKGLLSWDSQQTKCDLKPLEAYLEEALKKQHKQQQKQQQQSGEILLQYAEESLAVEILLNPTVFTLTQCLRNVLRSPTGAVHVIYSGAVFDETGSWILNDGTFSAYNFYELVESEQNIGSLATATASSSSVAAEANVPNTETNVDSNDTNSICMGHRSIAEHLSCHDIVVRLHTTSPGEWNVLGNIFANHNFDAIQTSMTSSLIMAELSSQKSTSYSKHHQQQQQQRPQDKRRRHLFHFDLNPSDSADGVEGSADLLDFITERLNSFYGHKATISKVRFGSGADSNLTDSVGYIRLERPTIYVFPGGQGDCALFGLDSGFTMLIDGGFMPGNESFWNFIRHLQRLDSVVVTHLGEDNIFGLSTLLENKVMRERWHSFKAPQIGYLFCNDQFAQPETNGNDDRLKQPLLDVSTLTLTGLNVQFFESLKHLKIEPLACIRNIDSLNASSGSVVSRSRISGSRGGASVTSSSGDRPIPITLYHKVGHGTLYMYVLNPTLEAISRPAMPINQSSTSSPSFSTNATIPEADQQSICSLLVWRPHDSREKISRILIPGNCTQTDIIEGFDTLLATARGTRRVSRYAPKTQDDGTNVDIIELDLLLSHSWPCTGDDVERGLRKKETERSVKFRTSGTIGSLHGYRRSASVAPKIISNRQQQKQQKIPLSRQRSTTPNRFSRFRSVSPTPNRVGMESRKRTETNTSTTTSSSTTITNSSTMHRTPQSQTPKLVPIPRSEHLRTSKTATSSGGSRPPSAASSTHNAKLDSQQQRLNTNRSVKPIAPISTMKQRSSANQSTANVRSSSVARGSKLQQQQQQQPQRSVTTSNVTPTTTTTNVTSSTSKPFSLVSSTSGKVFKSPKEFRKTLDSHKQSPPKGDTSSDKGKDIREQPRPVIRPVVRKPEVHVLAQPDPNVGSDAQVAEPVIHLDEMKSFPVLSHVADVPNYNIMEIDNKSINIDDPKSYDDIEDVSLHSHEKTVSSSTVSQFTKETLKQMIESNQVEELKVEEQLESVKPDLSIDNVDSTMKVVEADSTIDKVISDTSDITEKSKLIESDITSTDTPIIEADSTNETLDNVETIDQTELNKHETTETITQTKFVDTTETVAEKNKTIETTESTKPDVSTESLTATKKDLSNEVLISTESVKEIELPAEEPVIVETFKETESSMSEKPVNDEKDKEPESSLTEEPVEAVKETESSMPEESVEASVIAETVKEPESSLPEEIVEKLAISESVKETESSMPKKPKNDEKDKEPESSLLEEPVETPVIAETVKEPEPPMPEEIVEKLAIAESVKEAESSMPEKSVNDERDKEPESSLPEEPVEAPVIAEAIKETESFMPSEFIEKSVTDETVKEKEEQKTSMPEESVEKPVIAKTAKETESFMLEESMATQVITEKINELEEPIEKPVIAKTVNKIESFMSEKPIEAPVIADTIKELESSVPEELIEKPVIAETVKETESFTPEEVMEVLVIAEKVIETDSSKSVEPMNDSLLADTVKPDDEPDTSSVIAETVKEIESSTPKEVMEVLVIAERVIETDSSKSVEPIYDSLLADTVKPDDEPDTSSVIAETVKETESFTPEEVMEVLVIAERVIETDSSKSVEPMNDSLLADTVKPDDEPDTSSVIAETVKEIESSTPKEVMEVLVIAERVIETDSSKSVEPMNDSLIADTVKPDDEPDKSSVIVETVEEIKSSTPEEVMEVLVIAERVIETDSSKSVEPMNDSLIADTVKPDDEPDTSSVIAETVKEIESSTPKEVMEVLVIAERVIETDSSKSVEPINDSLLADTVKPDDEPDKSSVIVETVEETKSSKINDISETPVITDTTDKTNLDGLIEPVKISKTEEKTETTESSEPIEISENSDIVEKVIVPKPLETSEITKTIKEIDSSKPYELDETPESIKTIETIEVAKSESTIETSEITKTIETTESNKPESPIEKLETIEKSTIIETINSDESIKTMEMTEIVDEVITSKTVETLMTSETLEKTESFKFEKTNAKCEEVQSSKTDEPLETLVSAKTEIEAEFSKPEEALEVSKNFEFENIEKVSRSVEELNYSKLEKTMETVTDTIKEIDSSKPDAPKIDDSIKTDEPAETLVTAKTVKETESSKPDDLEKTSKEDEFMKEIKSPKLEKPSDTPSIDTCSKPEEPTKTIIAETINETESSKPDDINEVPNVDESIKEIESPKLDKPSETPSVDEFSRPEEPAETVIADIVKETDSSKPDELEEIPKVDESTAEIKSPKLDKPAESSIVVDTVKETKPSQSDELEEIKSPKLDKPAEPPSVDELSMSKESTKTIVVDAVKETELSKPDKLKEIPKVDESTEVKSPKLDKPSETPLVDEFSKPEEPTKTVVADIVKEAKLDDLENMPKVDKSNEKIKSSVLDKPAESSVIKETEPSQSDELEEIKSPKLDKPAEPLSVNELSKLDEPTETVIANIVKETEPSKPDELEEIPKVDESTAEVKSPKLDKPAESSIVVDTVKETEPSQSDDLEEIKSQKLDKSSVGELSMLKESTETLVVDAVNEKEPSKPDELEEILKIDESTEEIKSPKVDKPVETSMIVDTVEELKHDEPVVIPVAKTVENIETESLKQIETTNIVESVNQTEFSQPIEIEKTQMDSTTVEKVKSDEKSVESPIAKTIEKTETESLKQDEPIETTNIGEPVNQTESSQPTEAIESSFIAETVEETKPSIPEESSNTAKSSEPIKQTEIKESADVETNEMTESIEITETSNLELSSDPLDTSKIMEDLECLSSDISTKTLANEEIDGKEDSSITETLPVVDIQKQDISDEIVESKPTNEHLNEKVVDVETPIVSDESIKSILLETTISETNEKQNDDSVSKHEVNVTESLPDNVETEQKSIETELIDNDNQQNVESKVQVVPEPISHSIEENVEIKQAEPILAEIGPETTIDSKDLEKTKIDLDESSKTPKSTILESEEPKSLENVEPISQTEAEIKQSDTTSSDTTVSVPVESIDDNDNSKFEITQTKEIEICNPELESSIQESSELKPIDSKLVAHSDDISSTYQEQEKAIDELDSSAKTMHIIESIPSKVDTNLSEIVPQIHSDTKQSEIVEKPEIQSKINLSSDDETNNLTKQIEIDNNIVDEIIEEQSLSDTILQTSKETTSILEPKSIEKTIETESMPKATSQPLPSEPIPESPIQKTTESKLALEATSQPQTAESIPEPQSQKKSKTETVVEPSPQPPTEEQIPESPLQKATESELVFEAASQPSQPESIPHSPSQKKSETESDHAPKATSQPPPEEQIPESPLQKTAEPEPETKPVPEATLLKTSEIESMLEPSCPPPTTSELVVETPLQNASGSKSVTEEAPQSSSAESILEPPSQKTPKSKPESEIISQPITTTESESIQLTTSQTQSSNESKTDTNIVDKSNADKILMKKVEEPLIFNFDIKSTIDLDEPFQIVETNDIETKECPIVNETVESTFEIIESGELLDDTTLANQGSQQQSPMVQSPRSSDQDLDRQIENDQIEIVDVTTPARKESIGSESEQKVNLSDVAPDSNVEQEQVESIYDVVKTPIPVDEKMEDESINTDSSCSKIEEKDTDSLSTNQVEQEPSKLEIYFTNDLVQPLETKENNLKLEIEPLETLSKEIDSDELKRIDLEKDKHYVDDDDDENDSDREKSPFEIVFGTSPLPINLKKTEPKVKVDTIDQQDDDNHLSIDSNNNQQIDADLKMVKVIEFDLVSEIKEESRTSAALESEQFNVEDSIITEPEIEIETKETEHQSKEAVVEPIVTSKSVEQTQESIVMESTIESSKDDNRESNLDQFEQLMDSAINSSIEHKSEMTEHISETLDTTSNQSSGLSFGILKSIVSDQLEETVEEIKQASVDQLSKLVMGTTTTTTKPQSTEPIESDAPKVDKDIKSFASETVDEIKKSSLNQLSKFIGLPTSTETTQTDSSNFVDKLDSTLENVSQAIEQEKKAIISDISMVKEVTSNIIDNAVKDLKMVSGGLLDKIVKIDDISTKSDDNQNKNETKSESTMKMETKIDDDILEEIKSQIVTETETEPNKVEESIPKVDLVQKVDSTIENIEKTLEQERESILSEVSSKVDDLKSNANNLIDSTIGKIGGLFSTKDDIKDDKPKSDPVYENIEQSSIKDSNIEETHSSSKNENIQQSNIVYENVENVLKHELDSKEETAKIDLIQKLDSTIENIGKTLEKEHDSIVGEIQSKVDDLKSSATNTIDSTIDKMKQVSDGLFGKIDNVLSFGGLTKSETKEGKEEKVSSVTYENVQLTSKPVPTYENFKQVSEKESKIENENDSKQIKMDQDEIDSVPGKCFKEEQDIIGEIKPIPDKVSVDEAIKQSPIPSPRSPTKTSNVLGSQPSETIDNEPIYEEIKELDLEQNTKPITDETDSIIDQLKTIAIETVEEIKLSSLEHLSRIDSISSNIDENEIESISQGEVKDLKTIAASSVVKGDNIDEQSTKLESNDDDDNDKEIEETNSSIEPSKIDMVTVLGFCDQSSNSIKIEKETTPEPKPTATATTTTMVEEKLLDPTMDTIAGPLKHVSHLSLTRTGSDSGESQLSSMDSKIDSMVDTLPVGSQQKVPSVSDPQLQAQNLTSVLQLSEQSFSEPENLRFVHLNRTDGKANFSEELDFDSESTTSMDYERQDGRITKIEKRDFDSTKFDEESLQSNSSSVVELDQTSKDNKKETKDKIVSDDESKIEEAVPYEPKRMDVTGEITESLLRALGSAGGNQEWNYCIRDYYPSTSAAGIILTTTIEPISDTETTSDLEQQSIDSTQELSSQPSSITSSSTITGTKKIDDNTVSNQVQETNETESLKFEESNRDTSVDIEPDFITIGEDDYDDYNVCIDTNNQYGNIAGEYDFNNWYW
ncbi:Methionine aminopeptidase 1B, chloroplastic [Blomia tropicalis]|nr:Methionine aminopeptidase 1B, chloroplastic [Blomia tropicalis]